MSRELSAGTHELAGFECRLDAHSGVGVVAEAVAHGDARLVADDLVVLRDGGGDAIENGT